MIIEQSSNTIDNTSLTSSTFNIEESPILFWVMSNALYQHKERAVLRELSANAWDSHKEANCLDTPISIQLPSELEPTLIITDYGIGMSKEDLETYYFSYFSSSKRATDDYIGGFGIGCKTPFIFSETYSVTTTKDNITTIALAVLSNGIPKAMYISSEVTNLPNSTSISIPVSTRQVQLNLLSEVLTLFNTWPIKPNITIGSTHKVDIPVVKEDLICNFIRIPYYSYYSGSSTNNAFRLNAVSIGLFEYKISEALSESLNTKYSKQLVDINNKFKIIYGYRAPELIFNLSVGEVDLSPSRETIENTTKNVDTIFSYLKKAVDIITKEVEDNVEQYFDDVISYYENVPATYKDYVEYTSEFYTKYNKSLRSTMEVYYQNAENAKTTAIKHKIDLAKSLPNGVNTHIHNSRDFIKSKTRDTTSYLLTYNRKGKSTSSIRTNINLSTDDYDNLIPFYLVNETLNKIAKYANYHDTSTITLSNGITIDFSSVVGISDSTKFNEMVKVFEGYCTVLDPIIFDIPKEKSTNLSMRTIADNTVVFNVKYNSTATKFNSDLVTAKEFYSTSISTDAYIVILNKDEYLNDWLDFVKTTLVDYEVLLLVRVHQPELKSKRFEKFSVDRTDKILIYNNSIDYVAHKYDDFAKLVKDIYSPNFKIMTKIFYASKLLHLSTSSFKSNNTKYIIPLRDLRVIKKLMGPQDFKEAIKFILHHKLNTINKIRILSESWNINNFLLAFPGLVNKELLPDFNNFEMNSKVAVIIWKNANTDARSWLLLNSPILDTLRTYYLNYTQ